MDLDPQARSRNRGIRIVRTATIGAVGAAVALVWSFGQLAEAYFSGRSPAPAPPYVPKQATPVQTAPPVVVSVVHHSGPPPGGLQPPGTAPGSAPAPPPPPACHSTPSHPC